MANENEEVRRSRSVRQPKSSISCGNVVTLDGSTLLRPQQIRGRQLLIVAVVLVIAAAIGFAMFSYAKDNVVYANEKLQKAVSSQISRGMTVDAPTPDLFIGKDDDGIRAAVEEKGYVSFENAVSDGATLEIIKLPSDVTVEEGKALYEKGLTAIDADKAAKLLTGMWRLDVSRGDSTLMTLRFADFTSGSAASALTSAMLREGLSEDTVTDSGIDESGNTYKVGTAEVNGVTVTWRISTCELKEIYSISALPDSAMYVGVRYSY